MSFIGGKRMTHQRPAVETDEDPSSPLFNPPDDSNSAGQADHIVSGKKKRANKMKTPMKPWT